MAINKFVSIKQAVQRVLDDTGSDHVLDTPILKIWAKEAELEIGSRVQYKRKVCVLTVKECSVELPCDAIKVDVVLPGDLGCDCDNLYDYCHRQGYLKNTLAGNYLCMQPIDYQVQDNCLVFDTNMCQEKITVQYLGLVTDDDGWPKILEGHVRAISTYLELKLASKTRWKKQISARITETTIREIKLDWARLIRSARADDGKPSEAESIKAVEIFNNPFSGVGINMPDQYGPFTTLQQGFN